MENQPLERAILVLDFLTTHPGRGFTLSQLSAQLRLNKSTAHSIMTTLTRRSLVLRNADTLEYRLGPALVPMGAVAERSFPALRHARSEADQLAVDFDGDCVIGMATGSEYLIVGRSGAGGPASMSYFEGQRYPLVPPLGFSEMVWAPEEVVEAWLDRVDPELTGDERDRYWAAVALARRQGYALAIRVPMLAELTRLERDEDAYMSDGRRHVSRAQTALAHDRRLLPVGDDLSPDSEISSVSAPVFGPDGTVLLAISVIPGEPLRAADAPAIGRALVRSAARVTRTVDGRPPADADKPVRGRPSAGARDLPAG
jgi:DNA-binding IclR family transcriptional regulator